MIRVLALTLLLLTGCKLFTEPFTFPPSAYDSVEQWAMVEARRLHQFTPDNCLLVAEEAQRMLLTQGVESRVVILDLLEPTNHAILCTERLCLDNGYLSLDTFSESEIMGRVVR